MPVTVPVQVARVGFVLKGERYEEFAPVPDEPSTPRDLVRTAQVLTEAIVAKGISRTPEAISCRKGCGACCRQVVPISQPEARHIAELIEQLPEPRKTQIKARFAAAEQQLDGTDLPHRMAHSDTLDDAERQQLAVDYFRQGIACPFLEDESCSIYEHRPLVCREYLVITPAENCAQPTVEPVVRITLPARMSVALGQLEATTNERGVWWLPLTLAPRWAATHVGEPQRKPPFDLLRELIDWLTRTA
jgi:Fe-S-cluster containining protein